MPDSNVTPTDDGVISLKPFLIALRTERRRILIAWGLLAVVFSIGAVTYYLSRPIERTSRIEFRLLFDGADRGQYPNGTSFAATDIIAASVLTPVYERNELERYISYDRLKSGLWVLESSRALELLNYEYQAKLADSKLQTVDRARIEAEFRQKLDALRVPQLSLQFFVTGRTQSPPTQVMEKVLNDILAEWAEQAAAQRGAVGYQVDVLTPNVILKDTLNQTLLIRYDTLRRHVERVLSQVDRLTELPGATTSRVGPDELSLIDLRTSLTDLRDFQLTPLIGSRLLYSLKPDEAALNVLYLEGRLVELRRFRNTYRERKAQLEAALQAFSAESLAPGVPKLTEGTQAGAPAQMSDTFLDRLIEIAGRSNAMDYRTELTNRIIDVGEEGLRIDQDIAFYEEALRMLNAGRGSRGSAISEDDLTTVFDKIQTRVVEILDLTNEAYATISAANLNPRSVLYQLTTPYSVQTLRTVTPGYLLLTGVAVMFAGGLVIIFGMVGIVLLKQYRLS